MSVMHPPDKDTSPTTSSQLRPCPYCSEKIQKSAKKCRYCGEWLESESRAKSVGPGAVQPVGTRQPSSAPVLTAGQPIDRVTTVVPGQKQGLGAVKIIAGFGILLVLVVVVIAVIAGASSTSSGGNVQFGSGYTSALTITGQHDHFGRGESVAWVANLSDSANSTTLTMVIAKASTSGSESEVYRTPVDVTNPQDNILANKLSSGELAITGISAPGKYVMRFLRGGTVLAQGTFYLTG